MNDIENLMFTTTRKHSALLSDLIGLARKLASEMSGKVRRKGRGAGRRKQREQGKAQREEKIRKQGKRKGKSFHDTTYDYKNVKEVNSEGGERGGQGDGKPETEVILPLRKICYRSVGKGEEEKKEEEREE